MASVTSHTSPHPSPYDFENTDDESWQYVDYSSGASAPGSVGFLPSPASGSLNGYAIVGHAHAAHLTPPQASVSPLSLVDMDQTMFLPAGTSFLRQEEFTTGMGTAADGFGQASGGANGSFLTPQEYLFADGELSQREVTGEFCPRDEIDDGRWDILISGCRYGAVHDQFPGRLLCIGTSNRRF